MAPLLSSIFPFIHQGGGFPPAYSLASKLASKYEVASCESASSYLMRIWPGGREHHVARRDTSRVPNDNLRCLTARLMYFSTSYTSTSLAWGKQYRLPFFTKAYTMRNSLLAAAPTVSLGFKGCICNSLSRLTRAHSLKSGLLRSRPIAAIHRQERSLGRPFLLICVML